MKEHICQKNWLAILGTAETLQVAPFDDERFERWAISSVRTFPYVRNLDCLFELHTSGYWRNKDVLTRLKAEKVPLYMQEGYKDIPYSIRYPIEEIQKYSSYLTSTIALMIALAYHQAVTTGKPKKVFIFGVNMFTNEEYGFQRPCCEYWLGRLQAVGVKTEIAPGSSLLTSGGIYGYENYDPVCYEFRKRLTGLQMGRNQAIAEKERWSKQQETNEGGIRELEYWLMRYQQGDIPKDDEEE